MGRQLVGGALLPSLQTRTVVDCFHKRGKSWSDNLSLTIYLRTREHIFFSKNWNIAKCDRFRYRNL